MKRKVNISYGSAIFTMLVYIILIGIVYWMMSADYADGWVLGALILTALIALVGLIYCPLSLSADEEGIMINRSLMRKRIYYKDIVAIEDVTPTMGEKVILGSRGFMGYWGWYSEKSVGRYFAYYGMASQSFLVRLTDGRQYMLGCTDTPAMKEFIRRHLNH